MGSNFANGSSGEQSSDDLLLILHSIPATVPFVNWSAEPPSLIHSKLMILEVPPPGMVRGEHINEIRIALSLGGRVLWIVTPESDTDTLLNLLDSPVSRIRPTRIEEIDYGYQGWAVGSSVSFVFKPSGDWIPIGFWGAQDRTWLACRHVGSNGLVIVSPAPSQIDAALIKSIQVDMDRLSESGGPMGAVRSGLRSMAVLVLICAISLSAARHWQKNINELFLASPHAPLSFSPYELPSMEGESRHEEAVQYVQMTSKSSAGSVDGMFLVDPTRARDVIGRMQLLRTSNLLAAHARLKDYVLQHGTDSAKRGLHRYLEEELEVLSYHYRINSTTSKFLTDEDQRYFAQFFLNSYVRACEAVGVEPNGQLLYDASRIVHAHRDGFVPGARSFYQNFAVRSYSGILQAKSSSVLSPEPDFVDYLYAFIDTADAEQRAVDEKLPSAEDAEIQAWARFLEKHESSSLADDAKFNILNIEVGRWIPDRGAQGQLSRHALEFAQSVGHSSLADDALVYAWRFAIQELRPDVANEALVLLNESHSTGDASLRLKIAATNALANMYGWVRVASSKEVEKVFLDGRACSDNPDADAALLAEILESDVASQSCMELYTLASKRLLTRMGWAQ